MVRFKDLTKVGLALALCFTFAGVGNAMGHRKPVSAECKAARERCSAATRACLGYGTIDFIEKFRPYNDETKFQNERDAHVAVTEEKKRSCAEKRRVCAEMNRICREL